MSEFKSVNFTDGAVDVQRLQQLTANQQYLNEQKIPIKWTRNEITKVGGLKIACGIVTIGPTTKNNPAIDVYFGSFFTAGCNPAVSVTYSAYDSRQARVHVLTKGLGEGAFDPDHRGMQVILLADPLAKTTTYFPRSSRVHWIAIGW